MSWLLNLIPALTQLATNGLSELGTLGLAPLPPFLTNNPLPNGYPWGNKTAYNTNPYEDAPYTGVIRTYNFNVSRGYIAPDGYNRSVILVNGAYPGPLIEANWGDTIQVTVNNNLDNEGNAIHWHGFLQKGTPYYDGVPAVDQCPIAPGKSLTYQFQADLYGSSWYHSHYSAQYAAGILGPMVIHGPQTAPYDIDLGPVLLSDWYHEDYFSALEQVMTPGKGLVFSDNNLINGKGVYNCTSQQQGTGCTNAAGLSKFTFTPGKTHRLRLVNTGAEGTQQFSIDGHNLTIIANDFVPVKAYTVQSVTLGIGQRTDVLVTANNNNASAAYWMRSNIVCGLANQPYALAAVYYNKANTSATPTSKAANIPVQCNNDDLTKTTPFFPFGAQPSPATTQQIDITFGPNATNYDLFYMNNVSFRADYNAPVLLLANQGNTSYPMDPEWNVYNFGSNSTVRMVIYNHFIALHPMHLHGHNFFVLAVGNGKWDGTITNVNNPQRRDVQILPGQTSAGPGYIVLQWNQDNPGVWPLHCHIAWHVSQGLYINVLERPADVKNIKIPSTNAQTCRDWSAWSGSHFVDQIDSGL